MNLLRCPFCSKRTQYLPSPCFVFTFVSKSTTVIGTLRISINLVSFTSKNFFPSFVLPLCLIPLSATYHYLLLFSINSYNLPTYTSPSMKLVSRGYVSGFLFVSPFGQSSFSYFYASEHYLS